MRYKTVSKTIIKMHFERKGRKNEMFTSAKSDVKELWIGHFVLMTSSLKWFIGY